jgi:type IV conjugative transfer system coupling protein TraD
MLNDFTGGGQIFLHKLRMFFQVLNRSCLTAFLVSIAILVMVSYKAALVLDLKAVTTYQKALIVDGFDSATSLMRNTVNPDSRNYFTTINAYDRKGLYAKNIDPRKIIRSNYFRDSYSNFIEFLKARLLLGCVIMLGVFLVIYLIWSRFGRDVKSEKKKEGSDKVLSALEVRKILKTANKASHFHIGRMPLVKDSATKHLLVTGSTGSGKTNLIHNILPQVVAAKQPAIVIDQTGEMIAKYYNSSRGDIIFNPFDARGSSWDFWSDCSTDEELERFSRILFSFNRKKTGHSTDPFWEQSAETVFNAVVKSQRTSGDQRIEQLCKLVRNTSLKTLQTKLKNTEASRYLESDNKTTASSILSVLSTNTKPLSYLRSNTITNTQSFSLKEYFQGIGPSQGQSSNSWLFLATKPSSRDLTLPLIACLSELAFSRLLDIGIKKDRRIWFVIDELSSLGKLPALSTLMAEGRKYGACVLAGLQSLNQLYSNYGRYEGSTIFGQFGTSFFFQNKEPEIAKMVSSICGTETIYRQQKNTSFGAHEFRDGVSYSEQQQQKDLVEYSDLANLSAGECFVLLPESSVRIAKLQTPEAKIEDKNMGFIQSEVLHNKATPQFQGREEEIGLVEELENGKVSTASGRYENTENNTVQTQEDLTPDETSTDNNIIHDKEAKKPKHDLEEKYLFNN